jgi:predicted enzyme related to lactoylglutathione lyase
MRASVLTPLTNPGTLTLGGPLGRRGILDSEIALATVVHFEICVDDPEAAAQFYSTLFGWSVERAESDSEYWIITTNDPDGSGITGGITHRFDELNPTVNTIEVPSIDAYARTIVELGGKVRPPKIAIPGQGYVQYCQDPEGNAFAIMEYDELAH